jgi:RNA polymerase sigma-70 factor (ECF subfamily)
VTRSIKQPVRVIPFPPPGTAEKHPDALPPFVELLPSNLDALYRSARHIVGSDADAEDVLQETALRAFRSYGAVRDPATIRAWLFRILHNTAVSLIRREARRHRVQDLPPELVLEQAACATTAERVQTVPADDAVTAVWRRERVERALNELDPPFREAVWLVDGEGFLLGEAAQILDVPQGTLASRLFRGRRKMREALREAGVDPDGGTP